MENKELVLEDIYIERCNKETEELIEEELVTFLEKPITYLKSKSNEFIYIESPSLEDIKVDAISLELDDVFGVYNALLGFKVQKKHEEVIRSYFEKTLEADDPAKCGMMFNHDDGLWDINVAVNYIPGYKEDVTIEGALKLVTSLLENILDEVKNNK
ncbi:hypothetical protein CIB95_07870 [Lottiidibacillus patelloidae]|uniref:Branched-chain amino acid aminotransferase n=1 Tax=Lottiidibacillus patelloidae TaxID=2670334 RepID=A0A263BUG7_9BACI|nr:hypothetical protein [Lottiidibacillus patelloidae]OZM57369.1 hypothetical protein CIB95_07870 [Lottiidibacillus patelloidae]